jgi:AAHS family 4-hydroxybenzoate transporter-like MFS transporter
MSTAPSSKLDVGSLLDHGRWTAYQKLLTLLAALAVTFDGFDIQILGFSIPSIMADWHVPRSAFPPVIAVGLIGMAMGAPLAGYLGDRFGRRSALIGSILVVGSATLATAFCNGMAQLTALRLLTGVGAGGALPNASALASEFAPLRKRPVAVTFTSVCIPVGGMLGGLAAARPCRRRSRGRIGGAAEETARAGKVGSSPGYALSLWNRCSGAVQVRSGA